MNVLVIEFICATILHCYCIWLLMNTEYLS